MILKHRDKELLRFDWVDNTRVRIVGVNDSERRFLPLAFGDDRLSCEADAFRPLLEDWLVSRSAPVGRHFMRNLMDSLGLNINSPDYHRKALAFSKGLSLNDVYWVVPDDFQGTWAEFNLYDNYYAIRNYLRDKRLEIETDPNLPDEGWAVENGAGVFFTDEKPEVRIVTGGLKEREKARAFHFVRKDGKWTKTVVPAVSVSVDGKTVTKP